MLRWDLRRAFRHVYWAGRWPPELPDTPIIAYANHHHYYDGHLAWLLFQEHLDRSTTLWMEEWDRFPFFGAVGAQPFPADDPGRRAQTLRRTRRRFQERPDSVLIYYPGGALHRPDEGIASFRTETLQRLADLYPNAQWWPFAIHVTWLGDARPTALLTGGPPHDADGTERERLATHWHRLQDPPHAHRHRLLDGSPSAAERWSFSFTRTLFSRYL